MVPRIGIARVVNAILVVVKSLIRLPLLKFYLQGRHTLLETAQEYGISVSTLQRYLKNVPQNQDVSCRIHPIAITLQMDSTYWGAKLWSSHFHGCFKPQSITLSLLTW